MFASNAPRPRDAVEACVKDIMLCLELGRLATTHSITKTYEARVARIVDAVVSSLRRCAGLR
jgi:hypothetical protein